jgi:hypothetical protein
MLSTGTLERPASCHFLICPCGVHSHFISLMFCFFFFIVFPSSHLAGPRMLSGIVSDKKTTVWVILQITQHKNAARSNTHMAGNADTYKENDVLSIQSAIVDHLEYTLARNRFEFNAQEAYSATSYSLRDRLIESFNDTSLHFK